MQEHIKRYYENYDEDGRLFRDNAHMPEYLTTIRYFDRLFTPGMKILDACAGAGRYSFYLADKGCIVTACDLVEHNVGIIRSKPKADKLAEISVDFCKAKVKELGGKKITLSIIEEHTVLKNWYERNGFTHIETKVFAHLPFTAGYMEWKV